MIKSPLEYNNYIQTIFNNNKQYKDKKIKIITFQVTDACNLCCSYCYQFNKGTHIMSFETAKKFINYIFDCKHKPNSPFYIDDTIGLIIDFIGGEPFLQIDLIEQITEYFEQRFAEEPEDSWSIFHAYSFSSNGTLYFTDKVQKYIKKYGERISVGITVDGCKEFHDKCRLFPNGKGSYDLAIAAALDQLNNYNNPSTKITISPDNVDYFFQGFKNMIELGFTVIHANCVFENVWNNKYAKKYYNQLKLIANYIKENNLQDKIYFVIFEPNNYKPLNEKDKHTTWCGTSNNMYALDYKGDIYTCIRFMESSLSQEPIIIGNIEHGIGVTNKEQKWLNEFKKCERCNIFDNECLNCPIAKNCSYCLGCSYEQTGKLISHPKTICEELKAQALATMYYYKIVNDKKSYDEIQKFSYDFVDNLIPKEEYNYLIKWKEE